MFESPSREEERDFHYQYCITTTWKSKAHPFMVLIGLIANIASKGCCYEGIFINSEVV